MRGEGGGRTRVNTSKEVTSKINYSQTIVCLFVRLDTRRLVLVHNNRS